MEKSTHGVLFSSGEVPVPILSVVSSGTRDRRFLRPEVVAPSSHETEEQRKDDRSQCAQNGLYHGDPFAARWQNYRIARTISTMKSKCETLVMALSELIWWGFVP